MATGIGGHVIHLSGFDEENLYYLKRLIKALGTSAIALSFAAIAEITRDTLQGHNSLRAFLRARRRSLSLVASTDSK
jgi:hypothetical protein